MLIYALQRVNNSGQRESKSGSDRTERAVFAVPAGLTDARAVVAVTARAGRTASITVALSARRAGPAVVTETPLTGAATTLAALHRTHLCRQPPTH